MSLTLHINEKERDRLLTKGAEPLRPFLSKFEQSKGADKVDEPAVIPSLEVLRETRLLKIVRPKSELTGEAWRHQIHDKFVEELANELAKVMVSHKSVPVPYANDDDKARKAAHQAIDGLDAEQMVLRLRRQPEGPLPWINYISSDHHSQAFAGSSFRVPDDLVEDARYIGGCISPDTERGKALKALMDDLAGAVHDCTSIEAWLSTCLFIWWGAAEIFILQKPSNPEYAVYDREVRVAGLLRNYVATVLLVESVLGGDEKATTEDVVD